MHVSLRWLNDYIDVSALPISTISKSLTSIGLEVEGVKSIKPLSGDVVVGRIVEAMQHPNADKLRVCQVDIGQGSPLTIVCGAPNARPDLKVVVACIGATLPGDFKIKESKIRGEKSFGMLCSESELGLSEASDGIIELRADAPLGASVSDYLQLDDTVIEIGLTPNRSDCLGLIGLARDLGAKLNLPLKLPKFENLATDSSLKTDIKVSIEDPEACRRFVALSVQGVKPIPSPQWLQRRLQNAGMRPINVIVDVTNYVMLENAQPIHAYDERDIGGKSIIVRRAKSGESLQSLDGEQRLLETNDIVIADASKPIGLAGVMGGANSEIKDDTQNIVIEVAHFHPSMIRKTSKRFALHTEASHRFERGIDLKNIPWVARRVASLIQQCLQEQGQAEGLALPKVRIAATEVDVYPQPYSKPSLSLRMARLKSLTGIKSLEGDTAASILESLGFSIKAKDKESLSVDAPSWRQDMEREVDLIEEIARIHGYENIPLTLPKMQIGALPEHPLIDFVDQNKFLLASIGLSETISFPFMGEQDFTALGIGEGHVLRAAVRLANPLVEPQRYMRTTLAVGLLQALGNNRRHGTKGVKLFEVARSFHEPKSLKNPDGAWARLAKQGTHIPQKAQKDDRPIEKTVVAGILDQPFQAKSWNTAETAAGFYHAKSIVERWLNALGIKNPSYEPIEASDFPWLHPGASATVKSADGRMLGYIGELHPRTTKAYDFEAAPALFEIDLEEVLASHGQAKRYASGSIKFPPVTRDIALLVPAGATYAAFMKSFVSFKRRKWLKDQRLFDVYQGPNLPEGKKSMAFNLTFQAEDKTLTDQDVEKELEALLQWLKEDLSAELR